MFAILAIRLNPIISTYLPLLMRKLFTTLCLTAVAGLAFGQSQRLVVLEHFTQASCGPCASQNPALEATLEANHDKIVAIKYQVSWPGTDPMNLHNPGEVADRVGYYNVSGVPNTVLDGNQGGPGAPNTITTNSTIDARYQDASPFDITMTYEFSSNMDAVDVTMDITATQAVSGDLLAHIAVVEEVIDFEGQAPGSNGETVFHNVMKKMLPGSGGTTLPSSFAVGDQFSITESWSFANVYDPWQIRVIGFVQDNTTKETHQGVRGTAILPTDYDATATAISNPAGTHCGTEVSPVVTIQNRGGQELTSLDIEYSINGGTPSTYQWTGNLAALSSTAVTLPAISFTNNASNTIDVKLSNPNGNVDEDTSNDNLSKSFDRAPTSLPQITFDLVCDNYGDETTWDLKSSDGTVLYSGGPYTANATATETFDLTTLDCYVFTIYDSYGDGICCSYGQGSYTLTDQDGNQILTGGQFGAEESKPFNLMYPVSVDEKSLAESFEVYPNPMNDMTNVNFTLANNSKVSLKVINTLGEVVVDLGEQNYTAGVHRIIIDGSKLSNGIYFVDFVSAGESLTQRIVVNK